MIPLTKKDSTVVVSTHTRETTVVPARISKVWPLVLNFKWEELTPSHVKSSTFLSGAAGSVGSRVKLDYTDGSVWHLNVLEVSELNHFVTYELVDAEPSIHASSVVSTIRLQRVTDTDQTFLSWEHDFSNDADAVVVQDNKYKKLEYFADVKKAFSK